MRYLLLLLTLLAFPVRAENGFPSGRPVGHCWECMHGCTVEQDAKLCRWPPRQCFEVAPGVVRCSREEHR